MSDADSYSGQGDRQLPTLELGKRLKERGPFLLSCVLVLVCFLVATIFGITGLWQAWADGRWDSSYWVQSFLLLVVVPLVTAARAMLPLIAYFSQRASAQRKEAESLALLVPTRSKPASRRISIFIGLTPLLLIVVFATTAFGMQTYESFSYNALLGRIHTHHLLYRQALEEFPADYYYVKGRENIPFDAPAFLAPGSYSDGAVEVTVRLRGQEPSSQSADSLALLLHSDNTAEGIIFQISPNGDWSIGRRTDEDQDHAQTYLRHSSAIHTAAGASNRLAVIMRGQQYICYVNDQFIGSYQDSGPARGPVGLDVQTQTASVTFTDFTIYPSSK